MSKLNCKPGDLAVIVRSKYKENIGKCVTVLEPLGYMTQGQSFNSPDGVPSSTRHSGFFWWIEAQTQIVTNLWLVRRIHCCDHQLRPIRPQSDDTPDESTAWLPAIPSTRIGEKV